MDPLTLKPPFDATDKRMYGLPCFKGTRVPVRDLIEVVLLRWTV